MLGTENVQPSLTDTQAFCASLLRPGSIYEFLSRNRRVLFSDDKFDDLYPSNTGRPSIPASIIASVMVLQTLEGLSDREAMETLRSNLYWKMATGLALDHEGFSPHVLTYWRNRIAASDNPNRIFDIVSNVVKETSLLSGKNKRALDSTVLSDAVATQDTFTQLVAQIRRSRRQIPELREVLLGANFDYDSKERKPSVDFSDKDAVDQALSELVTDAKALISAAEGLELTKDQSDCLGLLALVSFQDVEMVDEINGRFTISKKVARDRVVSTVDPDARHVHKSRTKYIDGFKGHISIEPETELITACSFTKGNVSDAVVGTELLSGEVEGLIVYGDAGYSSGDFRDHLQQNHHSSIIKPHPLTTSVKGGFSIDDFTLDEKQSTLMCPAGHIVTLSPNRRANFTKYCKTCPLRDQCTRSSRGRVVTLSQHHQITKSARADFVQPDVKSAYNTNRPVVERIHAQMKRKMPSSKVRYRGVRKNEIYYSLVAALWNMKVLLRNNLSFNSGAWQVAK